MSYYNHKMHNRQIIRTVLKFKNKCQICYIYQSMYVSYMNYTSAHLVFIYWTLLPRCMECRRGLAMRLENSVCVSVFLSVRQTRALRQNEKNQSIFFYHTKEHLSYFSEKKNGWWGATSSTWNLGSSGPRWSKIADFEQIIACSDSALIPSEKKFN